MNVSWRGNSTSAERRNYVEIGHPSNARNAHRYLAETVFAELPLWKLNIIEAST
jgi:hypothetical protein